MAVDADPVFAVATIKPSDPNRPDRGFGVQPGQFSTFNSTLHLLITFAYGVQGKQVIGGPAWMDSEKFDAVPSINFGPLGRLVARNAGPFDFAWSMQNAVLDRPIIDGTGISGRYDFTLNWAPDEFQFTELQTLGGSQMPVNKEGDDLFTAIQKQLGLKLEATRAQTEVLVIDHAEKPSAN